MEFGLVMTVAGMGVTFLTLLLLGVIIRFLSRLFSQSLGKWVVKGGFALQLRLGANARTTKDIDLLALGEATEIYRHLREAGGIDLGDWFAFEVMDTPHTDIDDIGGLRYRLHSLLDGRTFERFHIDVGIGDPLLSPVE